MGKGGGSQQPQDQTVTQTNLPEYARPYFENVLQRGMAESYRGYTPFEGQRIAGFSPLQQQVQGEVAGMQTPGQFGAATGLTAASGLGALQSGQQYLNMATDPSQTQQFMSPYMQNVVDVQKDQAIRDAQKQQLGASLGAARQGTYGGARQLLAQTERERNLGSQLANIQAAGSQKAFEAAQQAQQFGSTLGLQGLQQAGQAGAQLGQLGTAEQSANLQRLQAQAATGAEQRALDQQYLDTAYADFLRQRDYPMERLGQYSALLRGMPMQLNTTQTTYGQAPSSLQQLGGLGLSALGLYNLGR
jgi:hypothetical protein